MEAHPHLPIWGLPVFQLPEFEAWAERVKQETRDMETHIAREAEMKKNQHIHVAKMRELLTDFMRGVSEGTTVRMLGFTKWRWKLGNSVFISIDSLLFNTSSSIHHAHTHTHSYRDKTRYWSSPLLLRQVPPPRPPPTRMHIYTPARNPTRNTTLPLLQPNPPMHTESEMGSNIWCPGPLLHSCPAA